MYVHTYLDTLHGSVETETRMMSVLGMSHSRRIQIALMQNRNNNYY